MSKLEDGKLIRLRVLEVKMILIYFPSRLSDMSLNYKGNFHTEYYPSLTDYVQKKYCNWSLFATDQ